MNFEHEPSEHSADAERETRFEGDHWMIDNDVEQATEAAQAVENRLREKGWSDEEVGQFRLAVDEAIKNAIIHGNLGIEWLEGESKEDYDNRISKAVVESHEQGSSASNVVVDIAFGKRKDNDGVEKDGVEVMVTGEIKRAFDEKKIRDMTSPERLMTESGRGVGLMMAACDELRIAFPAVSMWKFKKTGDEMPKR